MSTTPALINAQASGPIIACPAEAWHEFTDILIARGDYRGGALGYSPQRDDAVRGYTRYRPEEARLLAASYTAFDKAGRKLGIDAAKLAESIDLAALIRAAREVIAELDHDTLGAGTSARVLKLDGLLNRLPRD